MKHSIPHNQSLGPHDIYEPGNPHSIGEVDIMVANQAALIAAEEFALSMVPLLVAVNEVGGIAAAIKILEAMKEKK